MLVEFYATDNKAITQEKSLHWLAVFYRIAASMNNVTIGILQGSGWQAIGAKLNLVAYYLIGLPNG
jgi:MATE family multidrug resistance protein